MRTPRRTKKPRRLSDDAARRLFHSTAELYLNACWGTGTPARCDEYTAWLRMSRPYLSTRAQKVLGMSLHKFLRSKQLEHARHLLLTTPSSIQLIAIRSGFGTETTFTRHFGAAFGITPGQYREQEELKKAAQAELKRRLAEGTATIGVEVTNQRMPGDEEFAARAAKLAKRRR